MLGAVPYWVKSTKYPFRNSDATIFDLSALMTNVIPMPVKPKPVMPPALCEYIADASRGNDRVG